MQPEQAVLMMTLLIFTRNNSSNSAVLTVAVSALGVKVYVVWVVAEDNSGDQVPPLVAPETMDKLLFWADSCPAKNTNRMNSFFILVRVNKLNAIS